MQVILGYSSEWYPPLDQSARHITLCSSYEIHSWLFLSAHQAHKSSWGELFTYVYGGDVGVYMSMRLTWMFWIWKTRGRDRIRDNEFRWEKLDIALVSYGLL